MKSIEQIITDKQIDKVWQHANFGDTPKRKVILDALQKVAQGWSNGHTADCIIKELKLTDIRNGSKCLSEKGFEYLIAASQPLPVTNAAGEQQQVDAVNDFAIDALAVLGKVIHAVQSSNMNGTILHSEITAVLKKGINTPLKVKR